MNVLTDTTPTRLAPHDGGDTHRASAARPQRWSAPRAGTTIALVLAGDAAMHLLWATGSTWPATNEQRLSIGLLGFAVDFRPGLLVSLAGLLTGASAMVLARQRYPRDHRLAAVWRFGSTAVVTGLLLRGAIGAVWLVPSWCPGSSEFRWLNAVLYTPLCLGLGTLGRRWLTLPERDRLASPVAMGGSRAVVEF